MLYLLQGIQLNFFSAISLFGIIQAIIICGSLLFNKKYDIPTKRYYILLILVFVSINLYELILTIGLLESNIRLWILPVSFFPLIIPTTYFIVKYYLNPEFKVSPWERILYIPFIIGILRELYTTIAYARGYLTTENIKGLKLY